MSINAIDSPDLNTLITTLTTGNLKKQLQAIHELSAMTTENNVDGKTGEQALINFVREGMTGKPTAAHGSAYQLLYESSTDVARQFREQEGAAGLIKPVSDQDIDYSYLQMLLVQRDYQAADQLTMKKLCELAGERAIARKWVYFTEVAQFSITDLRTIDKLWRLYSEDRFGWSRQHELWMRLGKDWDRLWTQLIWKSDEGKWTRYPNEFVWDVSAPIGHLPLSNQLRGVRMIDSLLSHPAWNLDDAQ
ncbi:MAG: GUN4 N-terminal ARM-like repeat domain-containing protein [Cyanobacteria bacterium J06621_3]